jgi:kynurenine formamidase
LEFHRIVLGTNRHANERYILLIEDARIDPSLELSGVRRIIVAPLWLKDLDAAPVTILAELS